MEDNLLIILILNFQSQISEILFLGEYATSTQAVTCGLITREISSKNDKDFEDKVKQITKEAVERKYTDVSRMGCFD